MHKKNILVSLWIILTLMGCVGWTALEPDEKLQKGTVIDDDNIVNVSHAITKELLKNLHIPLNKDQPVLVASFVDLQYMEKTCNFGRMIAECISSRLVQFGYSVVEMKLRDSLYIKEDAGEFLLSREVRNISVSHNAQAVVVGTYSSDRRSVYVSARIVQANNGKIISSCDFNLPMFYQDDIKFLLR